MKPGKLLAHMLPFALVGIEPARAPMAVLSTDPHIDSRLRLLTKSDTARISVPAEKRMRTPESAARKRNRKRRGWR